MTKRNKMKAKPIVLPRVMSELITLSLRDLAKAERSEKYCISMGTWHDGCRGRLNSKCVVCQAGAVMAFSLGANPDYTYMPASFVNNERQLRAIDCLRTGNVSEAASRLGFWERMTLFASKLNRVIPEYSTRNPQKFKVAMRKLARDLRAAGL